MLVLARNTDEQALKSQLMNFIQNSVNTAAFNEKELAVVRKPVVQAPQKKTPRLFDVQYKVSQF